jgi:outer membrane protein assembly complex protein YaeT
VSAQDEEFLRTMVRSVEGQAFSTENVRADQDAILTYFFNDGYPDTTFSSENNAGPDSVMVNTKFVIQPGKRQYVRGVLVRGLEKTSVPLVASRILLKEGDALSQSQIGLSQQRLYDLGIFAKVETATQNPEGEEESKYVLFYVTEARKYSLNLGIGAEVGRIGGGTAAGSAGFAPRVSVGISRINFLGLGHTIALQTLASTQQRRALLNYLAPQFKGKPDLALTISALFNDTRDIRTFSARRWEGSVQLSQRFSKSDTGQLRLTFRRVTLSSVAITQQLIPLLAQPVRVGLVSGTFFRDRRDDPVDSRRGAYNSLDFGIGIAAVDAQSAGSSPAGGSEVGSFTRLVVRNSTYHQLKRDVVLARTVQFGYIGIVSGLTEIPLAERFFAGGASSHRGFPDNQAGPRDVDTGFPLGGTGLLFHSTELRFPLIGDNLGGVLFHDMGNVFSDVSQISFRVRQKDAALPRPQDFSYMVHAVGAGIRYRTPIGPLRVDLAYGMNSPRFFGSTATRDQLESAKPDMPLCTQVPCERQRINRLQFHFSLGQTF